MSWDPHWQDVTLYIRPDGGNNSTDFFDLSSFGRLLTPLGNAKVSTAELNFGSPGAKFDGNGDAITVANDSGLIDFSGPLTIRGWAEPDSISGQPALFGTRVATATAEGVQCFVTAAGAIQLMGFSGGVTRLSLVTATGLVAANQRFFWEISRDSLGLWRIFVDGSPEAEAEESAVFAQGGALFYIGQNKPDGHGTTIYFNGHIFEFQVTNGVCRNTAGYVVPDALLPTTDIEPPAEGVFGEITGSVEIDGNPVERDLIAISYAKQTLDDGQGGTIERRIVVGEAQSASDGTYTLQTPGFVDEVVVLALDNYGELWRPNREYEVGQRIRPTKGNETGYGYDITVAGNSGETEPLWWVPAGGNSEGQIGTATAEAKPLWWSVAHAPILPTAIEPEEPEPEP